MTSRWVDYPVRRQEGEDGGGDGKLDSRRRGKGELISVRNNK